MRNSKKHIFSIALFFLILLNSTAQETINVPLTNSSKAGFLKMGILNGSISITGYDGKEVVITGTKRDVKRRSYYSRKKNKKNTSGLKRISNNTLEFSASEYDNEVIVKSTVNGTTDFEIKVPRNFSLKLSTINRGNIYVENVNGSMDISNTNGKITLKDISGSVSADALNKDIVANFIKVNPEAPMAFSSLNGDIDITFPKNLKADVRIKSDQGEVFTDFDFKTKQSKSEVIKGKKSKGNAYRVKVEKWLLGSINGGGAELMFKTFNGDVILRAK